LIEVGVKESVGTAASPVPLRTEVTEETLFPNGCVSVAVREPVLVGRKNTLIRHVAFTASVGPQLEPKEKSPAFTPVIVAARTLRLTFPILDNVSTIGEDRTPTVT